MKNIIEDKTILNKFHFLFMLLICLFIVNLNLISAKTKIIAVLIIVDKYEDAESNNIAASVRNDYSTISQFLALLENRNLYTIEKITLKGGKTKLSDVTNALNKISSTKDDIIFVYFSGHGGMDKDGTFVVCSDGEFLYRKRAEEMISRKPNKFSIFITDACSNDIDGVAVMRSLHNTKGAKEGKNDAAYKKLFEDYSGFMSISASSEGEYAWSDNALGGYFTHYFFKESLIKNPKENWKENFEFSKKKVVQMFNSMSAQQRSQLAEEGIKSQTPKMYSQPVSKSGIESPSQLTDKQPAPVIAAVPSKVQIRIINKTGKPVSLFIDYNTDEMNWSEKNTSEKQIASNGSAEINKECTIYFESGKEEVGYELTEGNYELAKVNSKEIDLFEEGAPRSGEVDLEMKNILKGVWEMDDGEYISEITFKENNTYSIMEERDIIESGTWRLVEDSEGYTNLVLSAAGEEDIEFEISSSDDFSVDLIPIVDGKQADIVYYLTKLKY
ncbi:MAG: hypothetical protein CVV24_06020 [Ignavibacteriae bacterium HGW-Ignavibacteriae-3]|nr:MAG: hypothetical protein CVV24_06020 [Ignavibacteriae bacterium HGW-Ignavibacteriae-3]